MTQFLLELLCIYSNGVQYCFSSVLLFLRFILLWLPANVIKSPEVEKYAPPPTHFSDFFIGNAGVGGQ